MVLCYEQPPIVWPSPLLGLGAAPDLCAESILIVETNSAAHSERTMQVPSRECISDLAHCMCAAERQRTRASLSTLGATSLCRFCMPTVCGNVQRSVEFDTRRCEWGGIYRVPRCRITVSLLPPQPPPKQRRVAFLHLDFTAKNAGS